MCRRKRDFAASQWLMKKEMLISADEAEVRVAVLEDGVLEELYVERINAARTAGNIYKGRVRSVLPGMQAAFVDIGLEKDGFLYVSDVFDHFEVDEGDEEEQTARQKRPSSRAAIEDFLKKDQEILVQVVKEPVGTKGARLSSYISLPGRFMVLMPTYDHVGVSRRISNEAERARLREIARSLKPPGCGLIVRTAGEGQPESAFRSDIKYLTGLWKSIQRQARRARAPKLIHEELGLVFRVIRDYYTPEVERIVVDNKAEFHKLRRFVRTLMPNERRRIELYSGHEPLFDKYGVEEEIQKALRRKVWLKSGGYLIIDQTEALVAIDVNTGKYTGRDNLEQTVLRTNLEAAREIARQLRLRDLGGIIIVDFIDMEEPRNRERVIREFRNALERDKARINVMEISELGLVEMTRQRTRHSLRTVLCQACPYCDGDGVVMSPGAVASNALRLAVKAAREAKKAKGLRLKVHPEVALRLTGEEARKVKRLEHELRKKIKIEPAGGYHLESIRILADPGGNELVANLREPVG